ncbi:unnamed protein product, partial [Effrenium voratum]
TLCRALFRRKERDLRKAFRLFDQDRSGYIEAAELRQALPLMGEEVPDSRINELFQLVDKDKTGLIDFEEFSAMVSGLNSEEGDADAFAAFRASAEDTLGAVGGAVGSMASGTGAALSAVSTAWSANLPGLSPFEMRKAGAILNNMKAAGYSESMALSLCRALFCGQTEKQLQKAYKFFDADSNGRIDVSELKEAMKLMGEEVKDEEIDDLFKAVDHDGNDAISFEEFCVLVKAIKEKGDKADTSVLSAVSSTWEKLSAGAHSDRRKDLELSMTANARRGRSGGRSDTSTERSSKGPSDPRPSSLDCCRLKLHRSHRFRSKSVPSTGAPKKTVLAQGQAPSNCPAQKAEAINSNVATPSHTSSCTSSSTSSTVTTFSRSTTSPKSPPLTSTLPHDAEEFLEGGEELSPLKADSQESLQLTQPLSSLNPEAVLEFWPSNEMQKALFLDYDGTLREFEARPDLAVPTPELMRLLQALNDRQDIRPFIVSGRDADFLAQHFAGLNGFTLIAEHGYHISPPTDGKCQRTWELLEPFGG